MITRDYDYAITVKTLTGELNACQPLKHHTLLFGHILLIVLMNPVFTWNFYAIRKGVHEKVFLNIVVLIIIAFSINIIFHENVHLFLNLDFVRPKPQGWVVGVFHFGQGPRETF